VKIGGVVLAAGAGERMGRRPKGLLERDGVPLICRTITALQAAGADPVVVVLGHHADAIAPALPAATDAPAVTVVRNPDPDRGQVSSQRLGLAALPGFLDAVIVALADQPLLEVADVRDLLDAFRARPPGTAVLHPVVDGARGNPVVFTAAVRDAILGRDDDAYGCRHWQAEHADAVARHATGNRHFVTDVDTPDDLARLARESGATLAWPATPPGSPPPDRT
jgi:CTP:molybdopterin cytidylyltransferase MocA